MLDPIGTLRLKTGKGKDLVPQMLALVLAEQETMAEVALTAAMGDLSGQGDWKDLHRS